ncbi:MAG: hypothetical protein RJB38_1493 [Pseudomonadota bacterium]|jgi:protein-disulfide isomerase
MITTSPLSRLKLNLLALLGLIAVIVSWIQTHHFVEVRSGQAAFESFCTVGKAFDCNAIDASPYAELFAGIPLSAAAAGWWFAILILSLLARSSEFSASLAPALLLMTGIGSIFSVAYLWIMARVLQVGCLLCLVIDSVNFLAFGILVHSWVKQERKPGTFKFSLQMPVIVSILSLFVATLIAKGMQDGVPNSSDLRARTSEVLAATPLTLNLPETLPSIGSSQAPITIVKFSDFQCPSCRMGAQSLHPVLKRYGDRVRFVYRNFPLDQKCNRLVQSAMHPAACELAKGAICSQAQGRFEAYYERVFQNQATLKPGAALLIAQELNLDGPEFEKCLSDSATTDRVLQDIEEGINLQVESTPTFFVNGRRVSGALPPQGWNLLIEELLKRP